MNILFINPAFPYVGRDKFPLGLGYLAAIALQHCHHVLVVDENIGEEIPWIDLTQFHLICFTVTTPAFSRMKAIVHQIRNDTKYTGIILAGGHHPTFRAEQVLGAGVDIVVRGEGELSFTQLIEMIALNQGWQNIPNLSYKIVPTTDLQKKTDIFQHNSSSPLIQSLDSIAFPAWDVFRYSQYSPMSLITSRGCPYRCSYCAAAAFWEHNIRFRSVSNVIHEIHALLHLFPVDSIKFQDSVFTANQKHTSDLMTAFIEQVFSFQWTCETRADSLNPETIRIMSQANCKGIMMGLESGSQQILDQHERRISVDQMKNTCKQIMDQGIGLRISVIFGLPGETKDTIEETLALLREIKPNVTFLNLATAYPGCALEGHASANFNEHWVKSFGGHGIGGGIIVPEGMTPVQYRKYANYMNQEIHQLNKVHWTHGNHEIR